MSEDDGPLLLSHGDVLGVVVPVIAELCLEFVGDGRDDGVVGVWDEVTIAEEGWSFGGVSRAYCVEPAVSSDASDMAWLVTRR